MVKRSLVASPVGIQQAKRSFSLTGWTQENLAAEVNVKTRQPIWRFFTGKPVDRQIFMEICGILDLDWREIALDPPVEFPDPGFPAKIAAIDIDDLVQEVRSQRYEMVQNKCGILQLLDMNRPINIDDIYIDVNILEKTTIELPLAIANFQNVSASDFDRVGFGTVVQQRISGLSAVETYSKLRVLGKPGVGKTTFLQHLAIQCNRGIFASHQVPLFIPLRDFAEISAPSGEFSLLNYIRQAFLASGITNPSAAKTLLQEGRVLLLLDGMDEVLEKDSIPVLREIRRFSENYHKNQFVLSCRTALRNLQPRGFTDVEIAPFDDNQIATFAHKWFLAFSQNTPGLTPSQSAEFIRKLDLPENQKFRQLLETPLFLHLACWVFQGQDKFPAQRTEFYKQGLDLLLRKWDESKGIDRDQTYEGFVLPQKLKLMSQLAAVTFEKGQYFFEQRIIEQYIADYLKSLPGATLDPEELQCESEAMLKAIEGQHGLLTERARGVFSFSYLAFQEYFTARKIAASDNLQALDEALSGLVSHINDPHWREVFLLTSGMLRSADSLVQLMKKEIDALVTQDPHLQNFLLWANEKSQTIPAQLQSTSQPFYLALSQNPDLMASLALTNTLDEGVFVDAALETLLAEFATDNSQDFAYANACSEALNNIFVMVLDTGFYKSLQQLKEQLPPPEGSPNQFQTWLQSNYAGWVAQVKEKISQYRHVKHTWQFTDEQQAVLQRYYDANQLLIDCLNNNCEVTREIREELEATLLLPPKKQDDRERLEDLMNVSTPEP